MGNIQSLNKVSFQDMKNSIEKRHTIITVMKEGDDSCMIYGTVSIHREEEVINDIYNNDLTTPVIIYGYNDCDENIIQKYKQLKELGFVNVFIYPGGMFEWLLLQDIYTDNNFKTTRKELNLLKYKPRNNNKIDSI
jgi:hypothetical protein